MFDNGLTPAALERLALLSEELGEAQQVIGKIIRHGYRSCHPNDRTTTNEQLLEKELGDVLFAWHLMASMGDINILLVEHHAKEKAEKVQTYLHHNLVPRGVPCVGYGVEV